MGVRLIVYTNDILILAESEHKAQEHAEALVYLLRSLGFIINTKRSILTPSQTMEFLGVAVDTNQMMLRLPGEKMKKIRAEARKMHTQNKVSARTLSRLIGKTNATSQMIPPAPLFFRYLQMTLTRALELSIQNYDTVLSLTPECMEELTWWDQQMSRWNGRSLLSKEVDLVIDSDASLQGWGAACKGQKTGGPWSETEAQMHINCLKLLATTFAVKTFAKNMSQCNILLRIDNTTAVAYINNLGGTVSPELIALAKDLWMWCLERTIHIVAQHLPGI